MYSHTFSQKKNFTFEKMQFLLMVIYIETTKNKEAAVYSLRKNFLFANLNDPHLN